MTYLVQHVKEMFDAFFSSHQIHFQIKLVLFIFYTKLYIGKLDCLTNVYFCQKSTKHFPHRCYFFKWRTLYCQNIYIYHVTFYIDQWRRRSLYIYLFCLPINSPVDHDNFAIDTFQFSNLNKLNIKLWRDWINIEVNVSLSGSKYLSND